MNISSTKMLQILIDGQKSIRDDINKVREDLKKTDKKLTKRIDNIGKSVAYLEDDTPTIDNFDKLEKRVTNLETRFAKN